MMTSAEEKRNAYFNANPLVYEQYQEIKKENEEKTESFERKLNDIKSYVIEHCSFYSGFSIDDIFPVLNKRDFIKNHDMIKSSEHFSESLHISSTSGSTGIPFSVEQDSRKRARTIADLKVFGEYAGFKSHEKMLQLRAYNGRKLDRSIDEKENIWRYDITNLSSDSFQDLISFIREYEPVVIFGYTSTMESISEYCISKHISLKGCCKSILVGAEMLSEEIAEKIHAVFECPIFDRYSNMEMGIYAQREYGQTAFRLNKSSYYFEFLSLNDDSPVKPGEVGRIVVTDLYNHAFPMIRYDTGDLGVYGYDEDGNRVLVEVYGRRVDAIYDSNGSMINPHVISVKMWGIANVSQWQFIQKNECYLIKILPSTSGKVDEEELLSRMKQVLGENVDIRIEYVKSIPVVTNSQKRKYIINEVSNNG